MSRFNKNKKETKKDQQSKEVVDYVLHLYNKAFADKQKLHSLWDECFRAYDGTLFKGQNPDYAPNEVSNHVFSTIETVKPIILAQNPKIIALPKEQEHFEKAEAVQEALDYEWRRTKMFSMLHECLTLGLITGTFIIALLWDADEDRIGQIKPRIISPFNFFVDPMASSLDDAEYAGYASYVSLGEVLKFAPDKAEELKAAVQSPSDEWLTYGKDTNNLGERKSLLYIELYLRDYSTVMEEVENEDGTITQKYRLKYPNGRRIIIAGDVLLEDGENPYDDNGKFPFVIWRCYKNANKFWGMGEVEQIISPQKYANEVVNIILQNAQLMSNQVWILDKNSGVARNSLTNRAGLVVRKNPGTEVRRDAPPPLPAYLQEIARLLREDIEHISGVYDVTRGERPTGITAAAAIQALNEQAQGRIKLKVQALEETLSDLGAMWIRRIKQFWDVERTIVVMGKDYQPVYKPMSKDMIDGDWDIIFSAGSTMSVNKAARLEQLIRLSQTIAEDGLPVVDRQTLLENSEIPDVKSIIERFEAIKSQQAQAQQEQAEAEQMEAERQQALQAEKERLQSNQQIEMEKLKMHGNMMMQMRRDQMKQDMMMQQNAQREEASQEMPQENMEAQQQEISRNLEQLIELIELIMEMTPEQVAELVKQHPEIQGLLDILPQIFEQPSENEGLEGGQK